MARTYVCITALVYMIYRISKKSINQHKAVSVHEIGDVRDRLNSHPDARLLHSVQVCSGSWLWGVAVGGAINQHRCTHRPSHLFSNTRVET